MNRVLIGVILVVGTIQKSSAVCMALVLNIFVTADQDRYVLIFGLK